MYKLFVRQLQLRWQEAHKLHKVIVVLPGTAEMIS